MSSETSSREHLSLDRDLRVVAVSPAVLGALGLPPDELVGRHIREVLAPTDARASRFQEIGALAGSIAHDFNNLLTVIQGNIAAARSRLPGDSPASLELEQALQAGRRASELIAQLLGGGGAEPAGDDLDLEGLLEEATPLLRRVIGEDIALHVETGPVWPVRACRTEIEQVLLNLAVNARDAMPDGGRLLLRIHNTTAGIPAPQVRPALPPGDYVVLTFGDSGCGMDESTQQHLFEPFFTTKKRGTGLGLATVARIVGRLHGGIRVESQPGAGSLFEIFLPRASAAVAAAGRRR